MVNQFEYQEDLVSLVTPGWNGKGFVHRLLDSIIHQSYRPIQYIYVDDGSTDGTSEIVKSYVPKFAEAGIDFIYIRQENAGICDALMHGFQYVKGTYLSNPEYDDVLFPESIEKRVKYLKNHPDCAVVVADAWSVTADNIEERTNLASLKNPNRFDRNHFCQSLMFDTIFNAACYMVTMDRFDATHPDRKIVPYQYGPNQQILLPLYYHWNRGFIDEPLSLYVNRSDSLGKTKLVSYKEHVERLRTYRDVIYKTLDSIDMPSEDLLIYKRRTDISFHKQTLDLAFKYRELEPFLHAYNSLATVGEINQSHILMRQELEHPLFFSLYQYSFQVFHKLRLLIARLKN